GQTFEAPRTIASEIRGLNDAMVACGPPGSVYVIYHASPDSGRMETRRLESPATVIVLRSQDRGRTFDRPIELGLTTFAISFPGTSSNTLPAIAADPDSGLVCAAFTRHQVGARHADILLAASRDRGHTWSRAEVVTPQDQIIYFEPQVAIGAAGRIGVMALAMAHGKVSVVLMLSEPGSRRFGPPITITNHPFDPAKSGFGSRWFIGDNQALATTPGAFHPLWNGTHTGQLQLFTATVRVGS
ncbi:MAG: sialidase family protein, partial [Pseudonocardiaceae bacterium]